MAFYLENLKEAPKVIKQAPTTKVQKREGVVAASYDCQLAR